MKINPSKSKALSFTRARVKDPLNYTLTGQKIPEDSSCKYLGIIIRSDLSWADQVNHTVQKAWRALHFVMCVVKKGNLAQRRKIACMCALFKAYRGERTWKTIKDRLQAPSYLSRVDHKWKIRARKQRTDVGKYCFVNKTITD